MTQQTWYYKSWDGKTVIHAFLLALITYLILWVGERSFSAWWMEVALVIGTMLFFFWWALPAQWVESYQINREGLIIKHRFRGTKQYAFEDIKRLVFKERTDIWLGDITELKITFTHRSSSKVIVVSALQDADDFIKAINLRADAVSIIHQAADGRILPTVQDV